MTQGPSRRQACSQDLRMSGQDPRVLRDPRTLRPQGPQGPQDLRMSGQMPVKPVSQVKPSLTRSNQVQPDQAQSAHQSPTITSPQWSPVPLIHQLPTVTSQQSVLLTEKDVSKIMITIKVHPELTGKSRESTFRRNSGDYPIY